MRLAAWALGMALLLPGCVEGDGLRTATMEGRILVSAARALADAEAAAWRADGVLVTLRGEAATADQPGVFTFGARDHVVALDLAADEWTFSYAVPGEVALMVVSVDGDGDVSAHDVDLTTFTPDTSGYREYFEMTPVAPEWVEEERILDALRANASTRPFTEGPVKLVEYSLKPDARVPYVWAIIAQGDAGALAVALDPATWTFLEIDAFLVDGPATSFAADDDAGKPPSGLAVRGAYGLREAPEGGLTALRFDLAYSKSGRAFPVTDLRIDLDVGAGRRAHTRDGPPSFTTTLAGDVVQPGARFSVTVPLDEPLPPRAEAEVAFVTPKGAAVRLGFETPMTYGKSTYVVLS